MRLKDFERNAIVSAIKERDLAARVFLFGSRVDDTKKGGDIDLLVLLEQELQLLADARDVLLYSFNKCSAIGI